MIRGEIYYADLAQGMGSEQGGIRPVVIIQNDKGNLHSPTTICAPLTSRMTKANLPTHVMIAAPRGNGISIILLEQIRTLDKSRLREKVGELNQEEVLAVNRAIRISLGI